MNTNIHLWYRAEFLVEFADKFCKQNHNTHFSSISYLTKIVPFMRQCGKIWYSTAGHRCQYNKAHAHYMTDNEGYSHTHEDYVIMCAVRRQRWLREPASVLCYPYISCIVIPFHVCILTNRTASTGRSVPKSIAVVATTLQQYDRYWFCCINRAAMRGRLLKPNVFLVDPTKLLGTC
jgi:hypothetical protein